MSRSIVSVSVACTALLLAATAIVLAWAFHVTYPPSLVNGGLFYGVIRKIVFTAAECEKSRVLKISGLLL
ncbi:hypothetical protein [Paenibacillus terrae]|uniref:Uncharacterized protein n=1 Tax=Paenibacillus terrae TaxID=159743 RepID=A0A0D7WVG7_9BACL|nr:hypothetical protein [Paenibacillus terrae]KJD42713.1 hypothetical protein QD47_26685 [Paenibacillus terrae]